MNAAAIVLLALLLLPGTSVATTLQWLGGSSSNWHDPANWSPVGVPGATDDILVPSVGASPVISAGNASAGNLTVVAPATLTVASGRTLAVAANLTVTGVLTGPSGSRLDFTGSTLVNQGAITVETVAIMGGGAQTLSGSGQWTGSLQVPSGSTAMLGSDVTLGPNPSGLFVVSVRGTLIANGYTLALDQVQLLSGGLFPTVPGTVVGPGTLRFQGSFNELHFAAGVFDASLLFAAGVSRVVTALIPIGPNAPTTVAGGAELRVATTLRTQSDLTVDGILGGETTTSRVDFAGPTLTNAGTISVGTLSFERVGSQTVSGLGQWTGASVLVDTFSTTTLGGNVTMGPASSGFLALGVKGTLSAGGSTLALDRVQLFAGALFPTVPGNVAGPGTIRFQGISNELHLAAGSFDAPLLVAGLTRVVTALIPLGPNAPTTVASGAELRVASGTLLQTQGNLTVAGTLGGEGSGSGVDFAGPTLVNTGVVSIASLSFTGAGDQTVSGAGQWIGSGVKVATGSITTLASDITFGPRASSLLGVSVVGTLGTGGNTLTLNQVQLFAGGLFPTVPGNVIGPGTVRFEGANNELHLAAGSFEAPLLLAAGVTRVPTVLIPVGPNAATTVASGAELLIPGTALQMQCPLTILGALRGDGSNSRLDFAGPTLVNNGTISIFRLDFIRMGQLFISGSGQWDATLSVAPGNTTTLASPIVAGPGQSASVLVSGALDVGTHVLTLHGAFCGIAPTGVLKGNGTLAIGSLTLSNQGRIQPGESPGHLVVNGASNQHFGSTLEIEIAGPTPVTQYDRYAVTGHALLSDTLRINLLQGFTPAVGDTFRIMSFGSRTGFFDPLVVAGGAVNFATSYSDTSLALVVASVVSVPGPGGNPPGGDDGVQSDLPATTRLLAPAPNPSAVATEVRFELAAPQRVRLTVIDVGGRIVRTILDEWLGPGRHERVWDGRDRRGNSVAAGVYLLRFDAGAVHETRRLVRIAK